MFVICTVLFTKTSNISYHDIYFRFNCFSTFVNIAMSKDFVCLDCVADDNLHDMMLCIYFIFVLRTITQWVGLCWHSMNSMHVDYVVVIMRHPHSRLYHVYCTAFVCLSVMCLSVTGTQEMKA